MLTQLDSPWNGNPGSQISPAAQPGVYSCLWVAVFVTQNHRTRSKLADNAVFPPVVHPGTTMNTMIYNEWKLKRRKAAKKKNQRHISQHVHRRPVGGCWRLPHVVSPWVAKQGQLRHMCPWVEAQTICALSNLQWDGHQLEAQATSGFIVNIASKYYNALVTAVGLKGIITLSRMNACACKLSMSRIYYTYKVMFTGTLNLPEAIFSPSPFSCPSFQTKGPARLPSSHGVMAVICPPTESCSR